MTEQLDYATCMRLMKAGFPRQGTMYKYPFNRGTEGEPRKVPGTRPVLSCSSTDYCACPNTDELIRELGDKFGQLVWTPVDQTYFACGSILGGKSITKKGKTPLEAVKNLYLTLNEKVAATK